MKKLGIRKKTQAPIKGLLQIKPKPKPTRRYPNKLS